VLKSLWKILEPFHRTFYFYLFLIVIYEGFQIFESYQISAIIILFERNVGVKTWIVVLTVLFLYREFFMRLDNRLDWLIVSKISYPIYKFLKMRTTRQSLDLDMAWHHKNNSGALVGKINRGVDKVNDLINRLSWDFIPTIIQTILTIIPLIIFSWQTALVAVVIFPGFLYLSIRNYQEKKPLRQARHDTYETEWSQSVQFVQAVETLKMFGQQDHCLNEFQNTHNQIIDIGIKEARLSIFRYNRWRIRLLSFASTLILFIWIMQINDGALSIAGMVYLNTLTQKLFSSFWRFARLFEDATEAGESVKRLLDLLLQQPAIPMHGISFNPPTPVGITLEDVSFSYNGDEERALNHVNLEILPGQVIGIVGPSGAGKTTLRLNLTGLWRVNQGRILVGGEDVNKWHPQALINLFSYVPQGDDVYIFDTTIRDNIRFSRPDASIDQIEHAAKQAGIYDFITSLPPQTTTDGCVNDGGFDTQVGERGIRLSGGQKQRIALARAILADKPILILDEATSAVDAITEDEIQTNLSSIVADKSKTVIIVAHRLSTLWNIADIIAVMNHGQIVEIGTHQDLLNIHGLYADMVALQTKQ
jgi:ATP-binding cassette subfamily B protein